MLITHSFERGGLYNDKGEDSSKVIHYEINYETMKLEDLRFCSDQVRDAWIQNQEERDKLVYLFGSWKGGKEYEQAVLDGLQFCSGLLYRRITSETKVFDRLAIPMGTQVRSRLSDTAIVKVSN
jgi:hypothetical protein